MPPVLYVSIGLDGALTPEFNIPQTAAADLPEYAKYPAGGGCVGPIKAAPGGLVARIRFAQADDKPIGRVKYAQLVVASADASDQIELALNDGIDLSEQPAEFGVTTWTEESKAGTDLSQSGGDVRSAAGGVFWVNLAVSLDPAVR